MSVPDHGSTSTSSLSPSFFPVRDFDPLLKDLNEKKQSFRKNVVSLAAELKDARTRLASQQQSVVKEVLSKQEAETKAKKMEETVQILHNRLDERDELLQASASAAEKYLNELDELRTRLSATRAMADESTASAQSAQMQCLALLKELDDKNLPLIEHEDRMLRLGEQLDNLEKNLQERECSQKQLRDEVLRTEHEIMEAVSKARATKDSELKLLLDEVSPKNIEKLNRLLIIKDAEIARIKDEIRIMSAHWKLKTKELESQLEKQRQADQDLKKKVLKLEFCLQQARDQTRKLQRMGEHRDKATKELRDRLAGNEQTQHSVSEKENFWESSGFKCVVSMSMLMLVVFAKR